MASTRPVGWGPFAFPWERRRWEAAARELHQTQRRVDSAEARALSGDVLTLAEFERTRVEVERLLQRHRRAFGWRRVMRRFVAGFLALGPKPTVRLAVRVLQRGVVGNGDTREDMALEIDELAAAAGRGPGDRAHEEAAVLGRARSEVLGLDDERTGQLAGLCVVRPSQPAIHRIVNQLGFSADLRNVVLKYLSREFAPDVEAAAIRRMAARTRR